MWCVNQITGAFVLCAATVHPAPHPAPAHPVAHVTKHAPVAHPVAVPVLPPPIEVMPRPKPEDWNPAPALRETPKFDSPAKKGRHPMFTSFMHSVSEFLAALGWAGCILAALALYFTVRHGFPWVREKVSTIWTSIVGDWTKVEAVVDTVEADIKPRLASLEAYVAALKGHIQIPSTPDAPAPTPTPTPVDAADKPGAAVRGIPAPTNAG
jgi:hypothetical protein